jgi:hypothetical protein
MQGRNPSKTKTQNQKETYKMKNQITLPPTPKSGYVKVQTANGYRYEPTAETKARIEKMQTTGQLIDLR